MELKLNARVLHELKEIINTVPKEKLADHLVEKSIHKTLTMRRKLVQGMEEANKVFNERLKAVVDMINATNKKIGEHQAEIDEIKDESKSKEELEAEAVKAKVSYAEEMNQKLNEDLKAAGYDVQVLRRGNDQRLRLLSEEEVSMEISEAQQDFLKVMVDNFGLDGFFMEEDLLAAGDALGM